MADEYDLKDDDRYIAPPPLPAVAPATPPLPAQALSYPSPWFQARPGIITAIGVISIIVASLILASKLVVDSLSKTEKRSNKKHRH